MFFPQIPKRSPLVTTLLVGLFMAATAEAEAQRATAEAHALCHQVAEVYSTCGKKFEFADSRFQFHTAFGKNDVLCSDGRDLDYYDRMEAMDIVSLFYFPYEIGPIELPERRRNHDPGRLRSQDLLGSVFGGTRDEVKRNLAVVDFLGQRIPFQRNLGAADALARVGQTIMAEAVADPDLAKFIFPFTSKKTDLRNYAFSWRFVKGTTRLSTHSFATAIDLTTNNGPQYWLWDMASLEPAKAKIGESAFRDVHFIARAKPIMPQKIVDAFEANGFVWGGKWNHYDTMHFEYRPEFFPGLKISCPQ